MEGEWSDSRPSGLTPRGESSWYTVNKKLGGPNRRPRRFAGYINLLSLPGNERFLGALVATVTELSWLDFTEKGE
jgi:hypothetical protein